MKQPLTHFLLLLFLMSCLCLGYAKKRTHKKTHVVKHNNKSWKIKTVEGRAKGKGNDYQEDDVNGERLCSYFVAFISLAISLARLFKSTKERSNFPIPIP